MSNRGMDEHNVVYPHNGIQFSHKKEVLTHTTTRMNLKNITLSKISQIQKDTHCTIVPL